MHIHRQIFLFLIKIKKTVYFKSIPSTIFFLSCFIMFFSITFSQLLNDIFQLFGYENIFKTDFLQPKGFYFIFYTSRFTCIKFIFHCSIYYFYYPYYTNGTRNHFVRFSFLVFVSSYVFQYMKARIRLNDKRFFEYVMFKIILSLLDWKQSHIEIFKRG